MSAGRSSAPEERARGGGGGGHSRADVAAQRRRAAQCALAHEHIREVAVVEWRRVGRCGREEKVRGQEAKVGGGPRCAQEKEAGAGEEKTGRQAAAQRQDRRRAARGRHIDEERLFFSPPACLSSFQRHACMSPHAQVVRSFRNSVRQSSVCRHIIVLRVAAAAPPPAQR